MDKKQHERDIQKSGKQTKKQFRFPFSLFRSEQPNRLILHGHIGLEWWSERPDHWWWLGKWKMLENRQLFRIRVTLFRFSLPEWSVKRIFLTCPREEREREIPTVRKRTKVRKNGSSSVSHTHLVWLFFSTDLAQRNSGHRSETLHRLRERRRHR